MTKTIQYDRIRISNRLEKAVKDVGDAGHLELANKLSQLANEMRGKK